MRYKATLFCMIAPLCMAWVHPQQKEIYNIAGDWNVLAKDSSGALQYGAWRIAQQGTQLEVASRWAHIEGIRQSSGTIAENGRILVIGGPTEGWMESFSGMLSPDGAGITGTWSRVEGSNSSKGTFSAQRARQESAPPTAASASAAKPEAGGRPMIEAPGSTAEPRPAAAAPVKEEPAPPQTREVPPVENVAAPVAATAPSRSQPTSRPEPVPDRSEIASDLATLESLLNALAEQNHELARRLADVRNQNPDKDRLISAQLAKQQRIFKLLERLIHSKVELEELLEIFRRSARNP